MRPALLVLAALALVAGGCVHAHGLSDSRARVNDRARAAPATLTLATGETARAHALHLAPDLATWTDGEGRARSAPAADVVAVRFESRRRGALEGAAFGLAAGAVLGVGLGVFWEFGRSGLGGDPDPAAAVGAAAGAGAGLGALVGSAHRSRTVYARPAQR